MTKAPIDSDNMRRLRSYFPSTQRPALYHYTSHNNALSMADGEVWMTRADCLHDQEEIEHGLSILSEALGPHSPFSTIPNAIRKRLMNCYVLSLSQDSNNQYLVTEYARPPGAILEFRDPNFKPRNFRHMVPEGNNSYRAHYFEDLYVLFDGAVIYDDDKKREIVEVIVQLMPEMTGPDADPATYYDFVTRRLIAPFLLFKRRQFAGEAEYRYVFVRKHDVDDSFECSRDIRGRRSSYVKVLISPRSAPTIIKKFDGH